MIVAPHVLVVVGTRPEGIKLASVVMELDRRGVRNTVCVTGQHREMLDQVVDLFGIMPAVDLNLMRENQTPTQVAAGVLVALDPILAEHVPDLVLVQGDTTTVLAAAMAASYRGVRVAHLEAGLRSGDRNNPFPEEINRVLTTALASLHLAPTATAKSNLLHEGVAEEAIAVTGNTVIDSLLWARQSDADLPLGSVLHELEPATPLILLTAHRRESFGSPLRGVFDAIAGLATERGKEIQVLFPVHPNPMVAADAHRRLAGLPNVILCSPLTYLEMVRAMDLAHFIITDSGGIQEEAPALGKPVLVLRDVTERPEAVASGAARLVGTDPDMIGVTARRLLDDPTFYQAMAVGRSPYGDGHAAERVVAALLDEKFEPFEDS